MIKSLPFILPACGGPTHRPGHHSGTGEIGLYLAGHCALLQRRQWPWLRKGGTDGDVTVVTRKTEPGSCESGASVDVRLVEQNLTESDLRLHTLSLLVLHTVVEIFPLFSH